MISGDKLTREDTDAILKIIVREVKELGLYSEYREKFSHKEDFHKHITIIKSSISLVQNAVDVFWQYFRGQGMSDGLSSYVMIGLLDSKAFNQLMLTKIGRENELKLLKRINDVINNEASYLLENTQMIEHRLRCFDKNALCKLKKIFEFWSVKKDFIQRLDSYIKNKE
jgi:hypothetical protein